MQLTKMVIASALVLAVCTGQPEGDSCVLNSSNSFNVSTKPGPIENCI